MEWFVKNTFWVWKFLEAHPGLVVLAQVAQFVAVLMLFEFHWQQTLDDEFYNSNQALVRSVDKKTYDAFKYIYAAVPFICWWLFLRSIVQRFDSRQFLEDYGSKREL